MLKSLLFSCVFALFSFTANANIYYVTTVADTGVGSLRSLIDTANNNPGLDTVLLNLGVHDTIHIGSRLPNITDSLVITGLPCQNPTISGDRISFNKSAIAVSNASLPLTLNYLNIINCHTTGVNAHGAVYGGTLYINYCFFSGNYYDQPAGNAAAGAVCAQKVWAYNSAFYKNSCTAFLQGAGALYASQTHLYNCTFVKNSSADVGGAITGNGIGMQNCTVAENSAGSGGGVYIDTALVGYTIANSIIWGNTASINQNYAGILAQANTLSGGCNILQDTTTVDSFIMTGTDVTGTDPQFGTFGYYSGCVPVLPILCGSVAQNHAGCSGATTSDAEDIVAQGIRDAGAFELTRPVLGGDTIDSIPHGATANLYNYFNTTGYNITWPAGINDTSATAVDTGTYTVIATNLFGCNDTATATIFYNADTLNTGLKNISGSTTFKMYPNPAKDITILSWSAGMPGELIIKVNDMLGRVVFQQNLDATVGKYYINTSLLSGGVYVVSVTQNQQNIFSGKLIVSCK